MYHTLSKREKKIARECIDKGLNMAFTNALDEAGSVLQEWHDKGSPAADAYHKLYGIIGKHNKAIASRYDYITGSKYLPTVAELFAEKVIDEEDIKDFSDEAKEYIRK
jgi:hypothetical protein